MELDQGALAFAAYAVSVQIVVKLIGKGLLTAEEARSIFSEIVQNTAKENHPHAVEIEALIRSTFDGDILNLKSAAH